MGKTQYFIEAVDVLFLRGNKLFGDPGSFGESVVPPWPSVLAGALRSALLVHKGYDLARFARGEILADPELGTPTHPGTFTLTHFHLARRFGDGRVEPLFGFPADLVANTRSDGAIDIRRVLPHKPADGILSSATTEMLAVLPEKERAKPVTGLWLNPAGWRSHLNGQKIDPGKDILETEKLWKLDTRVGVGLDPIQRRAAEGKLFTVQGVVPRKKEHGKPDGDVPFDVGFLAGVTGAELPVLLTLRLGGDGRGALAERVESAIPEANYGAIVKAGRCRLILTTPGLFPGGWRPIGVREEGRDLRFELHGVKGCLVCAAVPRAEIISGWDIAKWTTGRGGPKPAQRVAPTGSVYWLEELNATAEALPRLVQCGLWSDPPDNQVRWAEGFNRVTIAAY